MAVRFNSIAPVGIGIVYEPIEVAPGNLDLNAYNPECPGVRGIYPLMAGSAVARPWSISCTT